MDLSIFANDKEKVVGGVWTDIGDSRYKVARHNNPEYSAKLRTLLTPFRAAIQAGGRQADELIDTCTTKAMAACILVDWENVTDEGVALDYSPENALMILKKYPDFRELIAQVASQNENYRLNNLNTIEKN